MVPTACGLRATCVGGQHATIPRPASSMCLNLYACTSARRFAAGLLVFLDSPQGVFAMPDQRRSILITGCSSGCGLDAARTLSERGWRVFASCRKEADCTALKEQGFESSRIDYQDEHSIRSGFAEVIAATGGTLDALYNNGAYAHTCATEDLPTSALRELFEANFFGWHTLTSLAVAVMRKQGLRGRGHIIQHSSGFGLMAGPFRAAYCASKHALEAHAQCLRIELADTDIHVCLLNTGIIRTQIREKSRAPFQKWTAPLVDTSSWCSYYKQKMIPRLFGPYVPDPFEDETSAVTRKVIRALESDTPEARYYVTKLIWLFAFLLRVLPSRAIDAIMLAAVAGVGSATWKGKGAINAKLHPPEEEGEKKDGRLALL